MKTQPFMKRLTVWLRKPWIYPILLALVLFFAYGLQIRTLGFYWDDWENIFLYRLNSSVEFLKYFMYDRPTTAWVNLVFFPILGDNPIKWQVFNLVLRYISVLGIWWTFCQIWPKRRYEIGWLVLLLAVFPGFFQQVISVAYSRQFAALALFSMSLALTVLSWRYKQWYLPFTFLAAMASFAQMMTVEYFVGLEIIRPFLLWFLLRGSIPDRKKLLLKVLEWWLPYIIPLIGFFVWRFAIFKPIPGTDDPNGIINLTLLRTDPVGLVVHIFQNILQDCVYLLIFIWTNTINSNQIDLTSKEAWLGWTLGALAAIIAGISLSTVDDKIYRTNFKNRLFHRDWLILGGIALIAGGLPVWITDRQIIVGQWSDRFSLGPMLGICIILVIFVIMLGYRRIQKTILFGLLLALSISSQMNTVNRYRLNWEIQRDYYWQLYWRVPAMKPGTALFGTKMPFGLNADYSVSYAINTIYAPEMTARDIPYWFFSSMRAYGNDIPDFIPDLPVSYTLRNIKFEGSTSHGIVTNYKAGPACVQVLRPEDEFSPLLSNDEIKLAQISNINQILQENPDPRVSPVHIFGPEPEHGWCYFYERAELARQFKNWAEVVTLDKQAFDHKLTPAVGMEYEPFIEGYAQNGDWEAAYQLTKKAYDLTNNMDKALCSDWMRLEPAAQKSGVAALQWSEKINSELQCQLN